MPAEEAAVVNKKRKSELDAHARLCCGQRDGIVLRGTAGCECCPGDELGTVRLPVGSSALEAPVKDGRP